MCVGGRGRPGLGEGAAPGTPSPMVPGLGEGASDSTSWTPCSRGCERMTSPAPLLRCLYPGPRSPRVAQTRASWPPLCTHRRRRRLRGGAASSPALPFPFTPPPLFFFFDFGRENRVFDSALFMFLLGNKRWLCVCVFSCVGFLRKWEEEKKKKSPPPLSSLSLPLPFHPSDTPSSRPFPLFVFLFCFAKSPHSCL